VEESDGIHFLTIERTSLIKECGWKDGGRGGPLRQSKD